MTTTSTMCGLGADEKSTSRVLKPPGGGSSDIFGTAPVASQNPTPQRTGNRGSSDIFGTSAVAQSPQGQAGNSSATNIFGAAHDHKIYGKGRNQSRGQFNPITGEPYPDSESPAAATPEAPKPQQQTVETASPSVSASVGASDQSGQGDSNLQAAPGKAQPQVHTSSRVTNPPGGHTHKLW